MRLKFGKLINSFMQCKICNIICCKNKNNQSIIGLNNNIQKNDTNRKKKITLSKKIRLIYYTFFYNESNDSLTAIETCLSPFIDCVSNFIRYLSWVIIIQKKYCKYSIFYFKMF